MTALPILNIHRAADIARYHHPPIAKTPLCEFLIYNPALFHLWRFG
jgi:hypothetical protein